MIELKPFWRTEVAVKAPYRVEQHEQEQAGPELTELNARFSHDPYWNRRFFSIQHVHDVIEGKTFHWFWSPMKELFDLSQLVFIMLPVMAYVKTTGGHGSIWTLVFLILALKCALIGFKNSLELVYWWRFEQLRKKHAH